jgi:hypothetical protein
MPGLRFVFNYSDIINRGASAAAAGCFAIAVRLHFTMSLLRMKRLTNLFLLSFPFLLYFL